MTLSDGDRERFEGIESTLRDDAAFMSRVNRVGWWRRRREEFSKLPPGYRIAVVGTAAFATILLAMQISETVSGDSERAAADAAKVAAIRVVLGSPAMRAVTGTCDDELRKEAAVRRAEPKAKPTAQEYDQALVEPGSAQVPCTPSSPDGAYTLTVDGRQETVTEADLLSDSTGPATQLGPFYH